jgi:hypothetical protein
MRRRVVVVEKPDLLGQAGWMYADLFLALMVIFLATISFVPRIPETVSSTITVKNNHSDQVAQQSMSKIYSNFDIASIRADIAQYEKSNGLPLDTPVSAIQIVGGYSSQLESPDQGAMRALIFGLKLKSADLVHFSSIGASLDSSPALTPNQVQLNLTFGG